MPIKYTSTVTVVDRSSGKKSYQNHYMHMQKTEDLIAEFNKTSRVKGKGKLNQKIRNELVRRGGIEFVPKTAETI
jgi:hypothetical protein|tara:strand:- start:150 stop:374 length:225 start_codon:yes stop_codon:yes gene_type:complete